MRSSVRLFLGGGLMAGAALAAVQVGRFLAVVGANARPVQAINKRFVPARLARQ